MFDRFTERARKIVLLAQEEAKRLKHPACGTEHILLALLKEGNGVAALILRELGVNFNELQKEIEKINPPGNMVVKNIDFTARVKKVFQLSNEIALEMGHNYVGTEHLLLALIAEGEGIASKTLKNMGLNKDIIKDQAMDILGAGEPVMANPFMSAQTKTSKSKTPALDTFGRDLTKMAREDKLDPVIGRSEEIERIVQILSRRTKNNPVLIGEPGVGKSAIVEGLATKIVTSIVPETLKNKRIINLDLSSIVAGTKYRGEFEKRVQAILKEIRQNKNIILFIDEIHTLVGAGSAEGSLDASNILKPALSKGELQCVGATTLDEYRKYIEKDKALERRFQNIMVDPPSVEETIQILHGLKDRYEAHHRVKILDEAIESAVKLSNQYISDRYLPDKAIDLIDEAGAFVRLKMTTQPADFKELEDQIKEIEKEKAQAINNQDFETAATLRDKEKKFKQKLNEQQEDWKKKQSVVEAVVDYNTIAMTIAKWTKIPLARLQKDETDKLISMEKELHKRLVGQDEAITVIAKAIRRNRAGISNPNKPIGSFIFLGPTGVGKTELAKSLAEFLFGSDDVLVRIDMSEYMEKFAVSRLVGAPPGYVGYNEGGELTEKVRRKPYSVVLLDEIEKAHPDVFNILLQILEDGLLTDATGRRVNFKNSIIIMTSNTGSREIIGEQKIGIRTKETGMDYKEKKNVALSAFKKKFRPEFINRIDEIIVFHPLEKEHIMKIIDFMLEEVITRLKENKEIDLKITKSVKEYLFEEGYDPKYGARPLRRAIQKHIEDNLAMELLNSDVDKISKVSISMKNGNIIIKQEK